MVVVELLVSVGLRPLGPLGWPALGVIVGTALWGASGALGGALVLFAYYLWNLSEPQRFPHFFSSDESIIFWAVGMAMLTALAAFFRQRLVDAEAAAVEAARAQAELEALKGYEERLRTITDTVPVLIGYIDAGQRFRFNNLAYESWYARPRSEITGRPVREVLGEPAWQKVKPHLERALAGGRASFQVEYRINGEPRHAQTTYLPDFDRAGRVRGVFVAAKDVGPLVAAHQELEAANRRLEQAMQGSSVALWDADLRAGKVYLSEQWAALLGRPAAESTASAQELLALVHPDDAARVRRVSVEAMKGERPGYAVEHRVRAADGSWKWVLSRGRVTERDPLTRRALRMIGTNVDVSDRKRLEQPLPQEAADGAYAGVVDRGLLYDRLRHGLARARRSGAALALLSINIDPAPDAAPDAGAAQRLRACLRATDTLARVGAGAFMALLEGLKDRGDAFQVAEKMLRVIREGGLAAGIGIAFPGVEDAQAEALVQRADAALGQAKTAGRD
ncbi:MAG: sensor domain-containing diguanylate cyclase, partial [Betaproteobacteria bacterium]